MPDSDPATHLLDVPGARLYYERRGSGPLLLMIGSPMDSTGFAGLASALAGMARWLGPCAGAMDPALSSTPSIPKRPAGAGSAALWS
ncbi:MAG TPA: hypothetical protein VGA04_11465 [Streptosporangiaceae bacterium]